MSKKKKPSEVEVLRAALAVAEAEVRASRNVLCPPPFKVVDDNGNLVLQPSSVDRWLSLCFAAKANDDTRLELGLPKIREANP